MTTSTFTVRLSRSCSRLKSDLRPATSVIHWPIAFKPGEKLTPSENGLALVEDVPLAKTWEAVLKLPATGKVKAVGVSNFTIEQIEGIYKATGVYPAVNQIEAHPLLPQDDLVAYAKEKNIHLTAYSPLGNNCP